MDIKMNWNSLRCHKINRGFPGSDVSGTTTSDEMKINYKRCKYWLGLAHNPATIPSFVWTQFGNGTH